MTTGKYFFCGGMTHESFERSIVVGRWIQAIKIVQIKSEKLWNCLMNETTFRPML